LDIEFDGVVAGYSPTLTILNGLSFTAKAAQVTLLIGPNGAGKSTALKTLFGLLRPSAGEIRVGGRKVSGLTPRELLAQGLALVPQGRNLFPSLSALHNLELGAFGFPRALLRERVEEVLARFPQLRPRLASQASTLSGGEQKQLEIARAMLRRPSVLLVDEPSLGLSPIVSKGVFAFLRSLRDAGTTVLMVEQNVRAALTCSDRALVLEMGRLSADLPADELLQQPDLTRYILSISSRRNT
jgi:branched-chain amino acid transport system ATP-binding protein